jgi:hypothetical protein
VLANNIAGNFHIRVDGFFQIGMEQILRLLRNAVLHPLVAVGIILNPRIIELSVIRAPGCSVTQSSFGDSSDMGLPTVALLPERPVGLVEPCGGHQRRIMIACSR